MSRTKRRTKDAVLNKTSNETCDAESKGDETPVVEHNAEPANKMLNRTSFAEQNAKPNSLFGTKH